MMVNHSTPKNQQHQSLCCHNCCVYVECYISCQRIPIRADSDWCTGHLTLYLTRRWTGSQWWDMWQPPSITS